MCTTGNEIKMVYGTQRTIRRAIAELVKARKPVFDVTMKRAGVFWFVATINTDKPHDLVV